MSVKHTKKQSRTDWKRLRAMTDREIDSSDIAPVDKSFFVQTRVHWPQSKRAVSLRLDPDLLAWFKSQGRDYQARINAALRVYVEAHKH
jgi:uncharacterized protein (DUF4415 family)